MSHVHVTCACHGMLPCACAYVHVHVHVACACACGMCMCMCMCGVHMYTQRTVCARLLQGCSGRALLEPLELLALVVGCVLEPGQARGRIFGTLLVLEVLDLRRPEGRVRARAVPTTTTTNYHSLLTTLRSTHLRVLCSSCSALIPAEPVFCSALLEGVVLIW